MAIIDAFQRRRQAAGAATEARRIEELAVEAAAAAKRAREQAEKALPAANREAQQAEQALAREAEHRLKQLEGALAQARALEASDRTMLTPQHRQHARTFLHGGPSGGSGALHPLATGDSVVGSFREVSRVALASMEWAGEREVSFEFFRACDAIECAAWSGALKRIRFLAGESL